MTLFDYAALLDELKVRIRTAQIQSVLAMNRGLIVLYWDIGRSIWRGRAWRAGAPKSSSDCRKTCGASSATCGDYPPATCSTCGPSPRRIPTLKLCNESLHNCPGNHNVTLLEKLKDTAARLWYAEGVQRARLDPSYAGRADRQEADPTTGKAATNFHRTLPAPQSALAQQVTKDPTSLTSCRCAVGSRNESWSVV